jgi:hypothetical protein
MDLKQELLTVDLLLLPDFLKKVWESRETYELDNVVTVGQPVTRLPPHRSRRAEFPHRALR